MKTLIVYYSYEGNTKIIAETIGKSIEADIMELKPEKEMTSKGFMKYVWGGRAAVMKKKPVLVPLTHKMEDYDLIIFGTPVWAGTFAPTFNTLFSEHSLKNKKVALFCCHAGGMGKVFSNFEKSLEGNNIIDKIDIVEPITQKLEEKLDRAKEWGQSLILKANA